MKNAINDKFITTDIQSYKWKPYKCKPSFHLGRKNLVIKPGSYLGEGHDGAI